MGKNITHLKENIEIILNNSQALTLQSSKINNRIEKYLLTALQIVQERIGRGDLLDMTYTIVKELCINGAKANHKRIFFEEEGLNINSQRDYHRGIQLFKKKFSSAMAEQYGLKAREKGIYIRVFLSFNQDGMHIEVANNTPITPFEESLLREHMRKGLGYNDIAEYYLENMDESEGAGLGIALIIILMKGAGIDPLLFRIFTLPDKTIARVEIPFQVESPAAIGA